MKKSEIDKRFSELLDKTEKPKKEVITITIDYVKGGLFVDYQADDNEKKNWKDCNTRELIAINGAANVLKAGTEITTQFGKIVGNLKELKEILGIDLKKKKR